MIRKVILYIIFLSICLVSAKSQEVTTGLPSNPVLNNLSKDIKTLKSKNSDPLELPFFDDFSGYRVYPDPTKWSDDFVFVNDTYSDKQITSGVATFDALDNSGRLYETASSASSEADHLTSQPINLAYLSQDNLWLSFYYEPGGLADRPEVNDSLALHFFAPQEEKWYSVWRVPGNEKNGFRLVMLNINDPRFLKKGFRFRFVNYASLSTAVTDPAMAGNCDQWNLDYVLLNRNRHKDDTTFADVAFRFPIRSLLKTHEAMPWKQFQQIYLQEMGSAIPVHYRNNDIIVRNVTRNFDIRDVYQNVTSFAFSAGAANAEPLSDISLNAGLVYTYNSSGTDSALFRVRSWLITDDFDPKTNDTITYYQNFSNYFAFDDGSAEAGYGINGLGSRNAMVAYRFRSYMKDTVRAISICFNDSYLNSNRRTFDLIVWDNNNGLPGNIVYSQEEVIVKPGSSLNGFHTYILTSPVEVNGIFYVGWRQKSETFLNAGIDINTLHGGKQFYWINGNWNLSQVKGTLMIRPVLGAPLTTGINDVWLKRSETLRFRPNPAKEMITIDLEDPHLYDRYNITIFDLRGRELINIPFSENIDISKLHDGIYIIVLKNRGNPVKYSRLIKIR
jgi:hypothetical protein